MMNEDFDDTTIYFYFKYLKNVHKLHIQYLDESNFGTKVKFMVISWIV